jgi:hypothetical protein
VKKVWLRFSEERWKIKVLLADFVWNVPASEKFGIVIARIRLFGILFRILDLQNS